VSKILQNPISGLRIRSGGLLVPAPAGQVRERELPQIRDGRQADPGPGFIAVRVGQAIRLPDRKIPARGGTVGINVAIDGLA